MNVMLGLARVFSPYQLNPFDLNPLRDVVRAQFDFERIRRACPLKLFIAATAVRTGKVRLFRTAELGEAAVLASACLPTLHHAVEIDGEHYWDGGFTANPAIYPLLYECDTPDLLMVLLNPLQHQQAPRSAAEIATRSMELGFSTTFLREMRMIAHARQFIAERPRWAPIGRLERRLLHERFHLIDAPELGDADSASKLDATASSLLRLRELGRARAEVWLQTHADGVGRRETIDVGTLFQ
jgi:NTE family protein